MLIGQNEKRVWVFGWNTDFWTCGWLKIKTPHKQTPKDDSFSPLYICSCGVYFPLQPASWLPGKLRTRLRKISKSRRRSAAPKYPLALLQRADLVKNSLSTRVECRNPSPLLLWRFRYDSPSLLLLPIPVNFTPIAKTRLVPRQLQTLKPSPKTLIEREFYLLTKSEEYPLEQSDKAGSRRAHTNR